MGPFLRRLLDSVCACIINVHAYVRTVHAYVRVYVHVYVFVEHL